MPKVKTQPVDAPSSQAFFAGQTTAPAASPEPPMLAGATEDVPAVPQDVPPTPAPATSAPIPAVATPIAPAAKPPLPPTTPDPFVLLWSRSVEGSSRSLRGMDVPGGVVLKTSWSSTGGFIAESSCFVPDVCVRNGQLVAPVASDV